MISPLAAELISCLDKFPSTMKVRELLDWFSQHPYAEHVAVDGDSGIGGVVSRNLLNSKLAGNKFNSAIFAEKNISQVMNSSFLKVDARLPLPEVVKELLAIKPCDAEFCEEVAVYDDQTFLGLISLRQLIFRLTLDLNQMLHRVEREGDLLGRKNRELITWVFKVCCGTKDWAPATTASVPTIVVDDQGAVIVANPAFLDLTGKSGDLAKAPMTQFLTEQMQHLLLTIDYKPGGEFLSFQTSLAHADGALLQVETAVQLATALNGRMLSVIRTLEKEEELSPVPGQSTEDTAENLTLDQALNRLHSLVEFAEKLKSPATNLRGPLGEFSVVDLLQLLIQSQKSGEIRFTYPGSTDFGLIYLNKGMVVHAIFNAWKGQCAIREIIQKADGEFVFTYDVKTSECTIETADPMSVLMEACAEIDES